MVNYIDLFIFFSGFFIVAIASLQVAKYFPKIKLPLITGFLFIGLISGPFILKLVPHAAVDKLNPIFDFSLAFIAFAAGSELYLKEIRGRFKSIFWITIGQLVITFVLGSYGVFYLSGYIPFMQDLNFESRLSISLLMGTIFVANSPASAIAVINEMRAAGPFTKTAIGVTVVKDVLVIILFACCFAVAKAFTIGVDLDYYFLIVLVLELIASFGLGYILAKILEGILVFGRYYWVKIGLILATGFGVFVFAHFLRTYSKTYWGIDIYLEPLLICIIGSFILTNFSNYRLEFLKIIHEAGTPIYVLFFTLTGATLSLDILVKVWSIALVLFGVRLITIIIGSLIGGRLVGDSWKHSVIGWMPFVTQAGVGIGLATVVANEFGAWGAEFATITIAVIILNQVVGPPIFKWYLTYVGENHNKAQTPAFDGTHDCVIFGLENQSIALARQLKDHNWNVTIATKHEHLESLNTEDIPIIQVKNWDKETYEKLGGKGIDAIVTMVSDDDNFIISELAYEHFGTKDVIVRLNDRVNFDRFHDLGALIVDPSTAIVSLLDHFVRSPHATSLLLGMAKDQDSVELEILNEDMHGITLRELRIPSDVIILSVSRGDQMIISHGYTRLRLGDFVSLVGSTESLEKVRLKFENS